jgi:hypothetical protein
VALSNIWRVASWGFRPEAFEVSQTRQSIRAGAVCPAFSTVQQLRSELPPSAETATNVARYRKVLEALSSSGVRVMDGVALFDLQPDPVGLFTLRIDNHPNERGHALLANAVLATIEHED